MTQVTRHTLNNGLRVIMLPKPSYPVVSCWLWYRFGSRHENFGMTGGAHWVEHMLFKGGGALKKGDIDRHITEHGGIFNGMTDRDYTVYFETLPAGKLDLALLIESERMANAAFDPKEFESERSVVISEREGAENEPEFYLEEELFALAFLIHPYHWSPIGWKHDLKSMTRDVLHDFYRERYGPNNATLLLSGRLRPDEALEKVSEYFNTIPSVKDVKDPSVTEPPQSGERRSLIDKPGTANYIKIGFHIPQATHEDIKPLLVLDAILSGGKPLGARAFIPGESMGRSSRLYQRLIMGGLATRATSHVSLNVDPSLATIDLTLKEGVKLSEAEAVTLDEIDKIIKKPPTNKEMKSSIAQLVAQHQYDQEGVTWFSYLAGKFEMIKSYEYLEQLFAEVVHVKAEEVQRVAETYLTERNRTTCWFRASAR